MPAQEWNQLVPHPVPFNVKRRVCRVFGMARSGGPARRAQRGLGLIQQQADQTEGRIAGRGVAPPHPGQPLGAGSAQQSQKKQFHLVIRVMAQSDGRNAEPPRRPRQKFMPQLPAGHLQGEARLPRRRPDVSPAAHPRQLETAGRLARQSFVGLPGSSAQLMVEMRHRQFPPVNSGPGAARCAAAPSNPIRPKRPPGFSGRPATAAGPRCLSRPGASNGSKTQHVLLWRGADP